MSADRFQKPLHEMVGDVRARKTLASDWLRHCLDRIATLDSELGAFLAVDESAVMEAADSIDRKISDGRPGGSLAGVPVAIKDNISTLGLTTTCASRMLEKYKPAFDATIVARLKEAGAIVLGKTNMDEFAMGSTTTSSAFGPAKNPWDQRLSPGGSSGGTAAAVAAGLTGVGIGSDTGGSIRQPAAWCGVSGIKPTWGRVSRWGLVAYGNSLDQIGPLARHAGDLASILSVISGADSRDATCRQTSAPTRDELLSVDVTDLKLGWLPSHFEGAIDSCVAEPVRKAIDEISASIGGKLELTSRFQDVLCGVYYIIAMSQASSNLSRFDGVRYTERWGDDGQDLESMYRQTRGNGFGREVQRRILLGTFALSAGAYDQYFVQASRVRRLIRDEMLEMFRHVDVILSPVTAGMPVGLGEKIDHLQGYRADTFTVSANLAGLPAMSVPCGMSKTGLPIGLQLIAAPWREDILLSLATRWQKMTDWHMRRPS